MDEDQRTRLFAEAVDKALAQQQILDEIERSTVPSINALREVASENSDSIWMRVSAETDRFDSIISPRASSIVRASSVTSARWRVRLRLFARLRPGTVVVLVGLFGLVLFVAAKAFTATASGVILPVFFGLVALALLVTMVGIFTRSERDERRRDLKKQAYLAEEVLVDALVRQGITPILSRYLQDRQRDPDTTEFFVRTADGLSEVFDPLMQVSTDTSRRLQRLLDQMKGGSIGVAGARGSGKSSLLRLYCDERAAAMTETKIGGLEPSLRVFLSAPVDYDARDFILHMWASACREILKWPDRGNGSKLSAQRSRARGLLVLCLSFALALLAAAFLGAMSTAGAAERHHVHAALPSVAGFTIGLMILIAVTIHFGANVGQAYLGLPPVRLRFGSAVAAVGVGSVLVGAGGPRIIYTFAPRMDYLAALGLCVGVASTLGFMALMYLRFVQRSGERLPPEAIVIREAADGLRRIVYQRTSAATSSGTIKLTSPLKLPIAAEATQSSTETLQETIMSLPEITKSCRDLLDHAAALGPVVIGIDEIDKIADTTKAHRFLDEIKSVFGARLCFFLVSVSDDALAAFERRGLPFRDAFDSAFDEVIHVNSLSIADSNRLIVERVVGLSNPFVWFSHCLSGGLPRDLIRAVRTVVDVAKSENLSELSEIALAVLATELEGMTDATILTMKREKVDWAVPGILQWARTIDGRNVTTDTRVSAILGPPLVVSPEMLRRADQMPGTALGGGKKQGPDAERHFLELLTFVYYSATMSGVFADYNDASLIRTSADASDNKPGSLEALAAARRGFAVDIDAAWAAISSFRRAHGLSECQPEMRRTLLKAASTPSNRLFPRLSRILSGGRLRPPIEE